MTETGRVRVEILPGRLNLDVLRGTVLLDVLGEHGLVVDPCGGRGRCGRCRARWLEAAPPPSARDVELFCAEELEDGWRLACDHRLTEDARVWVAPVRAGVDWKSSGRVSLGRGRRVVVRHVAPAGHVADRADASRADAVARAAGQALRWSPEGLGDLSALPDVSDVAVYAADGVVTAARAAAEAPSPCAVAVDLGTSVLGLYLVDLERAEIVASESVLNPQAAHGADVMSRIAFVQRRGPQGLDLLRRLVRQELDAAVGRLAESAGIERGAIFHLRVVGNPTMLHLFFGVDPQPLGRAPFRPVFRDAIRGRSAEAGIALARGACVDSLPSVSGFVGADAVAAALRVRLGEGGETALLMDVGTNAELLLAHRGQVYACSAAAGPALESSAFGHGAGLAIASDGGRPSPGVLRGTTLLDLLAERLDAGAVRADGRIVGEGCGLAQRAVREIQLAVAALRGGVEHLLASAGATPNAVSRVAVSGSFGVRLDPRTMVRVGLLPPEWGSLVQPIENAAGVGAAETLTDVDLMGRAAALAGSAHSVPLGGSDEYVERFVRAMSFPSREETERRGSREAR